MYAGKTSASWSKYNIQKKNARFEPEFKGTGGEAYTTSAPSPYLSVGPTHIYRNEIINNYVTSVTNDTLMQICLSEQTGRQNRSPYFTFRGAPSEKYIFTLISLQWDFNLLACLHNFSFTFHNIRNCLPLPLLTLPAPTPPPPG